MTFASPLTLHIIFLLAVQLILYPNSLLASLNPIILISVKLSIIYMSFPFTSFLLVVYSPPVHISYKLNDYGSVLILVRNTYSMCAINISTRNLLILFIFYLIYNYFISFFILIFLYTMYENTIFPGILFLCANHVW